MAFDDSIPAKMERVRAFREQANVEEMEAVKQALREADWCVGSAARLLGWPKSKLHQALGLDGRPNARMATIGVEVRRVWASARQGSSSPSALSVEESVPA